MKSEEKLLERLDQPLLDVIDNPQKTQQTTAIGRYFDKRSNPEGICACISNREKISNRAFVSEREINYTD